MQQQSVKSGYETGLMLSYIPAETDGLVIPATQQANLGRGAATVVLNPLADIEPLSCFTPQQFHKLISHLVSLTPTPRTLVPGHTQLQKDAPTHSEMTTTVLGKRSLRRIEVTTIGADLVELLAHLDPTEPCIQLDFSMSDEHIDWACELATQHNFIFCAWMPGYRRHDVLRLQLLDPHLTDFTPAVVNPTGQYLLDVMQSQLK